MMSRILEGEREKLRTGDENTTLLLVTNNSPSATLALVDVFH